MRERISALMDDQGSESELDQDMVRLRTDSLLRRTWDTYHLIGDALRGDVAPGLCARVSERLAAEPTVLAPQRRKVDARAAQIGLSAAAGVAGIALVAWLALPQWQSEPRQVAAVPPPAAVAAVVAAPASPAASPVKAASPAASPVTPAAVGVENYLLAHQRFSHANAMQGVAPYARTVADEHEGGAR